MNSLFSQNSLLFIYLRTLFIGTFGGFVFYKLNMPIAFMLGAIVFNMFFAFSGFKVCVYPNMVKLNLIVLGVFLGSSFSQDVAKNMYKWLPSVGVLGIFVFICVFCLYQYFTKIIKLDKKTAYFSSTPGGMTQMVFISKDLGADDRVVVLVHSIRVLIVVFAIPFGFRFFTDLHMQPDKETVFYANLITVKELIILLISSFFSIILAKKIRLPAYLLTGSMISSMILYSNNICLGKAPQEIINIVQIIIGSAIGSRFYGVSIKRYFNIILSAVFSTLLLIIIGLSFAYLVHDITKLPFYALILAYTPGGVADMCLISLSLGVDIAFVSMHHIIRIIYIIVFIPFFVKKRAYHLNDDMANLGK